MSIEGTAEVDVEESQDDAAALASAMAGYNSRGVTPPEEVPNVEAANPEVIPDSAGDPSSAVAAQVQPPEKTLAEELAELKAKVTSISADHDPAAVRRMHGEIGDINRKLKQLEPAAEPAPAPVEDELTAAMRGIDEVAEEFPELTAPLVAAVKALAAKQATATAGAPVMTEEQIASLVAKQRQRDAIEALAEEHPDFETVRDTPAFKAWEASKPPEYQEKLRSTWNPAVVSKGLSEFKATLQKKAEKQNRLANAVTPVGVPTKATPSTLPDEAGFAVGYNKGMKRLTR